MLNMNTILFTYTLIAESLCPNMLILVITRWGGRDRVQVTASFFSHVFGIFQIL